MSATRVVIAGAWTVDEQKVAPLVEKLLKELRQTYPQLRIISGGCDRGVGKIVKNRCEPTNERNQREYDWLEVNLKIFWEKASKAELAQIWAARNSFWVEAGEEFHIFMDKPGHGGGAMQDLLEKVQAAGLPYSLYYPGDTEPKLLLNKGYV